MKRRGWLLILLALWVVALAVLGLLMFGRCRPMPPPPPTATLLPPPNTPTATIRPQLPTATPTRAQVTREATATATIPRTATATPTAANLTPTAVATATLDLMGHHRVARGDTMWDIGLLWYRGRYFAWGEDVWRPICAANPEVADCRLIYPGEVLRIPELPAATPRP